MTAAMTKAMTALEPIWATASPDSEKIPAAIIVPRPIANAILKSSVLVCSAIAITTRDRTGQRRFPSRRTLRPPSLCSFHTEKRNEQALNKTPIVFRIPKYSSV